MAEFKLGRIRFVWKNNWQTATTYVKDDVIRYGGKVYICVVGHTSSADFNTDLEFVPTKWNQVSDGSEWKDNWATGTFYKLNDIVKYGGTIYICIDSHTSAATATLGLEADQSKWNIVAENFDWKNNWATTTRYKVNDIVKYGAYTYVCNEGHTSSSSASSGLEVDQSKWDLYAEGFEWRNDWTTSTRYRVGDVVKYGGQNYVCNQGHTSAGTASDGLEVDQSKWDYFNRGFEYKGTWSGSSVRYKVNDVVKFGSGLWICITPHTSSATFAEVNWNQFVEGLEFESSWSNSTTYQPGDVVTYGGYAYVSKTNHVNQTPTTNSDDWDLLSTGFSFQNDWTLSTAYRIGHVVRFGGYTYVSLTDHTASALNQPPDGTNWSRLNSGFRWLNTWANATAYRLGDVVKDGPNSYVCILQHTSTTGVDKPANDVTGTYWNIIAAGSATSVLTTQGDIVYYGGAGPTRLPIGQAGQLLRVSGSAAPEWAYWGVIDKVYYVATSGTDDTVANGWGTTLDRPWKTIRYACSQVTGPATIFVKTGTFSEILPISVPAGVAIVGDELRGTVIQPATGYETSNMFYMRNGTGLRNCTLQGLSGTLGADNAYGTKRPSAGAYVSLDPGTGPADTSVWITTKSPYVQNVTTFGTGCVGLKVDGTLHNGGNDSIVANDFTQILSDGIGVWCTGIARTELVSVFSYYGHIGYLAENGGKIRATNGNSSYGTFGCVSEGVDSSETPITATVNNRWTQAIIGQVNTSGTQLYNFEYTNAGIDYTSATFTISGTGINAAAVADEFRDGGVFNVRLTDPANNKGGAGYVTASNVAQGGNAFQITLAATDSALSSAYIGMRVQIVSGTGVGQFGTILDYNNGSKIAKVYKDSAAVLTVTATASGTNRLTVASTFTLAQDMPIYLGSAIGNLSAFTVYYVKEASGSLTQFTVSTSPGGPDVTLATTTGQSVPLYEAGWEHVVAGTPAAASLDLTTSYLIEPRLTFTTPTITATSSTITSGTVNFDSVVYGDYVATYTNIGVTGGAGSNARFNINLRGSNYYVTLNSGGTGYVVGNTLTIAGTSLGGAAPANNITVTVTGVNSGVITNFTFSGTGRGGVYVVARSNGTVSTSPDGITWTDRTGTGLASTNNIAYGVIGGVSYWVAVTGSGTGAAWTTDPATASAWTAATLPTSATWEVVFGNDRFIAISQSSTATAISTNASTWNSGGNLGLNGSFASYGAGRFVVTTGTTTGYHSTNGVSWTAMTMPLVPSGPIAYGEGKFLVIGTAGTTMYSFDGINWNRRNVTTMSTWTSVHYGQGLFIKLASGSVVGGYSTDGFHWNYTTLPTTATWRSITLGNPGKIPRWVLVASGTSNIWHLRNFSTARARAKVVDEKINEIRIVDPGSGYASPPTMTIIDPNNTVEAPFTVRIGDGVLANPTFTNRGTQYATAGATITSTSGTIDAFQEGTLINVRGLTANPTPGSNVEFAGDSTIYKLVNVRSFTGTGPFTAELQVSPGLTTTLAPAHNTAVTMRIKYSQVRLTGHDFLDIGTGNFANTNYPNTPLIPADSTKETKEGGGGRVFYTSTDQDGNFRVGTLFSIEQATGVANLNADAFNIAGLNELTLGAVELGGSGATITEFSTDPFFSADSDSIVPTQRAIKAYITSQIGGGGSQLNVNTLTAGAIFVAGNSITTTNNLQIDVINKINFTGGVDGVPVALNLFLQG